MFKPGVGGFPRGQPKPVVGKRRARKLKVALAVAEALHGPAPIFAGDSLAFLRGVMKGEIAPDPARMAAATALLRFEHPTLAMSAVRADINVGSRAVELASALRRMAKLSEPGG